jgi:hypothetical protein
MRPFPVISILAALAALPACAPMATRELHDAPAYAEYVYGLYARQPPDTEIKVIQLPVRLAVAQIGEMAPHRAVTAELRQRPDLVDHVVELPFLLDGVDRPVVGCQPWDAPAHRQIDPEWFRGRALAVCRLGRDLGAEYVFVFGGKVAMVTGQTPWSILDWTIVGAYWVPATRLSGEATVAGALIDVRDERIVFLANAGSTIDGTSPSLLAGTRSREMQFELRNDLMAELGRDLAVKLTPRP